MKDYEEMAKSVLSRRDAYAAERKKCMKKIVSIGSCFCLMLLLGVSIWHIQNSTLAPGGSQQMGAGDSADPSGYGAVRGGQTSDNTDVSEQDPNAGNEQTQQAVDPSAGDSSLTTTGSSSEERDRDMDMTSEELTSAMLEVGYTQAEVDEYQSIGYQMTWAKWWKFFHSIEANGGDFTLDALKSFSREELLINTGDLSGGAYVGGSNDGDSTLDEQKMSSPKDVVNGQVSDHPGSVANSEK